MSLSPMPWHWEAAQWATLGGIFAALAIMIGIGGRPWFKRKDKK